MNKHHKIKSKLYGMKLFDTNHLVAMCLSLCIILIIPTTGKFILRRYRKNFIYVLISIALVQELVVYISRCKFDGFNFTEDLPLHIFSYELIMASVSLHCKNQFCFKFSYMFSFKWHIYRHINL